MTVLDKAAEAVADRMKKYGPPDKHIADVASVWTTYLVRRFGAKWCLSPRDVCNMMVLLKVMRDANAWIDDNPVDIAGWARVIEMCAPVPERTDMVRVSPEELIGVIRRNKSKYPRECGSTCPNNVTNCTGHCCTEPPTNTETQEG